MTDSDRGTEDVGLAIRTVLSTWEGQALAGELESPSLGRAQGQVSRYRLARWKAQC